MRSIVLSFCLLLPLFANARLGLFEKGFVEIRPNDKLYVEQRKAQPGKPTIFCLNGLTWSTRDWEVLVKALDKIEPGLGVVLYDMKGMGRTLLRTGMVREPITLEEQMQDLEDLQKTLHVQGPTVVIGLSYGGGLALMNYAKNPNAFDKVIAISPFIASITDQDAIIRNSILWTRITFPMNTASDDELYDYFLRKLIYSTYPLVEPVVLENQYKLEAIFRMVQGARKFVAKQLSPQMRKGRLHVVGSIDDPYVKDQELRDFWQSLNGRGESYLRLTDTGHKSITERPELIAGWLKEILNNNPELSKGQEFIGDAVKGEAQSDNGTTIPLRKAGFCESIFRKVYGPF
jgi:pimeloyl-ACP methyl ester carboxylesterase